MSASFALRIESGEQAGETHAIGDGGLTVGRRPGNDFVIGDASVSGRHARFSLEQGRVLMVDLSSTNGSFVDEKRIEQATLEGGSFLRLGSVELELVATGGGVQQDPQQEIQLEDFDEDDVKGVPAMLPPVTGALSQSPSVPATEGELEIEGLVETSFDDDDDSMHRIDEQALTRSKGGPGLLPLLAGVLFVGGAAGWYFMGMPGLDGQANEGGFSGREVVEIPGNLLRDGSFESRLGVAVESADEEPEANSAWTAEETASVVPFVAEAWRYGGEVGLGADLDAGASVRVRSAATTVGRQRGLRAQARLLAEAGGMGRLGVEFFDDASEHVSFIAWSTAGTDTQSDLLGLSLFAPPGYDRARVVLELSTSDTQEGSVGFDDVGLVSAAFDSKVAFEDFLICSMGPERLSMSYIDQPLLVDMIGAEPALGERGLRFASRGGRFAVTLDPTLLTEGLATLGASGYQPHGDAFTDTGVTSVVIGSGVHQMRLVFDVEVELSGRPLAVGYRLDAAMPAGKVEIELGFTQQRVFAARLDRLAREAEAKGKRGKALEHWQELLDKVPFDGPLVLGAEAGRSRLISDGLEEVEALRGDFERAAFFGLPDLFRSCLEGIDELRAEYIETEVADAAVGLRQEVAAALAEIGDEDGADRRLKAARQVVLELSQEQGFEALSAHIKAALGNSADKEAN